jgi:DeoR family transcriptional regulator of aga operon
LLASRGKLSVEDIGAAFDVSPATVRRDLDDLADQRLITRTRGGAVLQSVAYDLPLRYKLVRQSDEKVRIAEAAAALVRPGAVVGLNGGTTTSAVARALATRSDLSGDGAAGVPLTIVTNALNIANEMVVRPHIRIVVVGGVARPQSYELIGPLASRLLDEITIETLFLGVNGFSAAAGAAAHHEGEADINRTMVERAEHVVVVADGSKIGQRAFARICHASAVHELITDPSADADELSRIRSAGPEVHVV